MPSSPTLSASKLADRGTTEGLHPSHRRQPRKSDQRLLDRRFTARSSGLDVATAASVGAKRRGARSGVEPDERRSIRRCARWCTDLRGRRSDRFGRRFAASTKAWICSGVVTAEEQAAYPPSLSVGDFWRYSVTHQDTIGNWTRPFILHVEVVGGQRRLGVRGRRRSPRRCDSGTPRHLLPKATRQFRMHRPIRVAMRTRCGKTSTPKRFRAATIPRCGKTVRCGDF